jgi:hypothetical protein
MFGIHVAAAAVPGGGELNRKRWFQLIGNATPVSKIL